jgi:iron complex transport system substrate-binding protein
LTGRALALSLALGVTLTGCRRSAAVAGGAVALVDDAGDTVRLGPPHRIVSLIPTTTEILVAAGLADRMAGRTDWCDWPPAAAAIPSVGQGFAPNIEAIVGRRPDLVLLYHGADNAEAAAQLRRFGVPVARLRTDRVRDVARIARLLGRITGEHEALERVTGAFERDLREVSVDRSERSHDRPRVLLLAWPDPPVALGPAAYLSELLELAGGRNAFDDLNSTSAPVSLEAIVARNPAAIFLAAADALPVLGTPQWRTVDAVRAGRVFTPLEPALTRAGLRAPEGVRRLRRWLLSPTSDRHTAVTLSRTKDAP